MASTKEKQSFQITLPSNACVDLFPANSPHAYKTRLTSEIKLSGEWEVALIDVQYPSAFADLHQEVEFVLLILPNENTNEVLPLRRSYFPFYELNDLDVYLRKYLKRKGYDRKKIYYAHIKIPKGRYKSVIALGHYIAAKVTQQIRQEPGYTFRDKVQFNFDPILRHGRFTSNLQAGEIYLVSLDNSFWLQLFEIVAQGVIRFTDDQANDHDGGQQAPPPPPPPPPPAPAGIGDNNAVFDNEANSPNTESENVADEVIQTEKGGGEGGGGLGVEEVPVALAAESTHSTLAPSGDEIGAYNDVPVALLPTIYSIATPDTFNNLADKLINGGINIIKSRDTVITENAPAQETSQAYVPFDIYMVNLRTAHSQGPCPSTLDCPSSIYVYSGLVKHQLIGNAEAQLLGIVPIQNQDASGQQYYSFNPPYYLDLVKNDLNEIDIQLNTDWGDPFPFLNESTTRVVCRLHFRRRDISIL